MMGPDLFKRWMDMLFWWLPRDSGQSGRQQPGGQKQPAQPEPTARAPQSETSATSHSTPSSATADQASGQAAAPQQPASSPQESTTTAATPSSDGDAVDDLTTIKGVGPAMAARLQDLGIRTFEDLAAADSKAVTRKLRDQSVVISEKKVEGWVQTARKQG